MNAAGASIESILAAAVEIPTEAGRRAYVDRACAGDADLKRRVENLIDYHFRAGSFLESPAPDLAAATDLPAVAERTGTVIGPYRLLEQIGEGGFGVVFLAEQTQPVRREVALKVLKPGMDTKQVVARFEAERQALALMDHPHIAKVFDGGVTPAGRPYFVMELVRGVPITEFCDQNRLTPRERLGLFVSVCRAVQHAHQKGVIHRDLKPSNILVSRHDTTPVVKVIDFGVAKALGQELTDKTLFTGLAQLVGTPLYMSPEQAGMSDLDADTRSDIYSLGVLLYELLTGTTPFARDRFRTAGCDEIRRIIREEEPPRPSTRLSTLGRAAETVSADRGTEPRTLRALVRGDLDWIVMKGLEKDRNQRYETAAALALDVERYLRDEPVLARPPSPWYRFRKLARRNRALFAGAVGAALATLLGVAALTVSNSLIRQEQARTSQEKRHAEDARRLAETRAEEVRQGLEHLKAANALLDRGRYFAGEHGWDDAHEAFTQAIRLHPEHVSVWVERADLYTRLGLWDLAAADYARELELREPETTMRWYQRALLRLAVGDEDGCRQTARGMRERFFGTLNPRFVEETARSSLLVRDPALDLPRLIDLCRRVYPTRDWTMSYVLGAAHYRAGQYDEAVRRLEEALAAQPQWAISRLSHPVLAMAHHRLGHEAKARESLAEAARTLDRWTQERYAGQGEDWVTHRGGDAVWPAPWWDYLECQHLYREARLLIDGTPPPDDPRLHVLRGRGLAGLDLVEQAAPEFEAALRLAPHDPQIRLEAHRNRGACRVHRHQWRDAAAEFAKAVELQPDDTKLWRFRAVAEFAAGDFDAHRETCTAMLDRFGPNGHRFVAANLLLACVLRDGAVPDASRLLPIARACDTWHWGAEVRGAALYRAGRYEEAVRFFEAAARVYRPRPWDWSFLAMAHGRLGHAAEARRCLSEATRWIDAANRRTEDDPTATLPAWGGWDEPIVSTLLVREAERLLTGEPGDQALDRGPR